MPRVGDRSSAVAPSIFRREIVVASICSSSRCPSTPSGQASRRSQSPRRCRKMLPHRHARTRQLAGAIDDQPRRVQLRAGIEQDRRPAAHRLRRADGRSADLQRLIGIVEGVGSASRVGDRSPAVAVPSIFRREIVVASICSSAPSTVPFRSSVPPLAINLAAAGKMRASRRARRHPRPRPACRCH